jgi:chromosome segregation ATPase
MTIQEIQKYLSEADACSGVTIYSHEAIRTLLAALEEKDAAFQEVKRLWHLCLDRIDALTTKAKAEIEVRDALNRHITRCEEQIAALKAANELFMDGKAEKDSLVETLHEEILALETGQAALTARIKELELLTKSQTGLLEVWHDKGERLEKRIKEMEEANSQLAKAVVEKHLTSEDLIEALEKILLCSDAPSCHRIVEHLQAELKQWRDSRDGVMAENEKLALKVKELEGKIAD